MISVQNLTKKYGDFTAVQGLNFEIGTGEVVAFLGPNGAGKTTTLRVLSSFLPPSEGVVRVDGIDVAADPLEVRRRIGYLPENNPLYEDMELSEYLDWAAELRGFKGEERVRRVGRAVEQCGLGPMLGREIGLLSKGYRQRVGLAQAILHDPAVLLLDEPTSGLDPNQALEVRRLLAELKSRKTVFVSTHILPEAEALADRVLIIHRGRIAAQGTPAELAGAGRTTLVLRDSGVDAAQAQASLLTLEGVRSAESRQGEGELRFDILSATAENDPREAVYRLAASRGWPLLELRRESARLEQIFHDLTLSGGPGA